MARRTTTDIYEVEEEETEETCVKVIGSVDEITNESQAAKKTSLEGTALFKGDGTETSGPLFRLQSKYRKDKNANRTNRQRKISLLLECSSERLMPKETIQQR